MSAVASPCDHRAPYWSILPPVPLMGVGTCLVESVEHYVSRLAWIAGTTPKQICTLPPPFDEPGAGQPGGVSSFCGPTKAYKHRIKKLEALTGIDTIRCGSFLILDELLASSAMGRNSSRQRWCPECFREWDEERSWEPLIWSVDLLSECPQHGCDLEMHCRHCGSTQNLSARYQHRRKCRKCNSELAGQGRTSDRPAYFAWTDSQVLDLIELCATPGQEPIPYSAHKTFVSGLQAVMDSTSELPAVVRAAIGRLQSNLVRGKMTLRTMINLCALQGISVREMLLDPVSASSRPLLDLWHGYRALEYSSGCHDEKIAIYRSCLTEVLKRCRDIYLPSTTFFMRSIGLNRDLARELAPEIYEEYEDAHRRQAKWSKRIEGERAFKVAMLLFSHSSFNPFGPCDTRWAARRIAAAANVSNDLARRVTRAALYSCRALERAKGAPQSQVPSMFVDPGWLRVS